MKIVSNPKKIQRNYKIGLYTSFAALIFLFGAVALTLFTLDRPDLSNYSFPIMLVGLVLSQVGVYYANRFGKSPRLDERLTNNLKGLDDRYVLYHYAGPVPHMLVGPNGVWVLAAQYHPGNITYENNKYRQTGVGFFARFVGQEGVSRPDGEAIMLKEETEKFLKKSLPEGEVPEVHPVIVFTSAKATVQAQDAPIPTMHVEKLKDYVRRRTREQATSMVEIRKVQELLPEQDVS